MTICMQSRKLENQKGIIMVPVQILFWNFIAVDFSFMNLWNFTNLFPPILYRTPPPRPIKQHVPLDFGEQNDMGIII